MSNIQLPNWRRAQIARETVIPVGTRCIAERHTGNAPEFVQGEIVSVEEGTYCLLYEVRTGPNEWEWLICTRHEIYLPR